MKVNNHRPPRTKALTRELLSQVRGNWASLTLIIAIAGAGAVGAWQVLSHVAFKEDLSTLNPLRDRMLQMDMQQQALAKHVDHLDDQLEWLSRTIYRIAVEVGARKVDPPPPIPAGDPPLDPRDHTERVK